MDLYKDQIISTYKAHSDVVGSVSFNLWDNGVVCSGAGQREFSMAKIDEFSDEDTQCVDECSVKIWKTMENTEV